MSHRNGNERAVLLPELSHNHPTNPYEQASLSLMSVMRSLERTMEACSVDESRPAARSRLVYVSPEMIGFLAGRRQW